MNEPYYYKISLTNLIELKKFFEFYQNHIWCDMNSGSTLDEKELKKDCGERARSGLKIIHSIICP